MNSPTYTILIHYSEIALKKKNRSFFENIFIKNIKSHLVDLPYSSITLEAARVLINKIDKKKWPEYKNRILNIMGLKNAILTIQSNTSMESFKNATDEIIKNVNFVNFRITTKRHEKNLEFDSQDVNIAIGEYVQTKTNKPVNLTSPDCNIIIEILKNKSFIGINKIEGYSGLPANCQEKAISLISSGIDSPVASFEMIKRGVNVDYVHFHSFPAVNKQSIDNVKKILKVLSKYQLKTTLYMVPLLEIQQEIMSNIEDKYWVIFFRRYMIKIANDLASQLKASALITGESVGQVASQTLSNIRAVSQESDLPILRPLAGTNKEDIVNRAKKIGTYDISIEPYEDCCSYFVPPHPETKAKIDKVKKISDNLIIDDIYSKTMQNIEKIEIEYTGE